MNEPLGLLLVGHGTRDLQGTAQFFELSRVLGEILKPIPVVPCLLELQQPDIEQGWKQLMALGVQRVCVAPLLLFSAGHARQDIPHAVAAAASGDPHVVVSYGRPLSRHPSILQLVVARIGQAAMHRRLSLNLECIAREELTPDILAEELRTGHTAVVMIGRGSHDPCARSDMLVLSEVIRRHFQALHWTTGFYAMAQPRMTEVLAEVLSRPGVRRVVVYPHLLFEGLLYQSIQQQITELASLHPSIDFRLAGYLGPVPDVARALREQSGLSLQST